PDNPDTPDEPTDNPDDPTNTPDEPENPTPPGNSTSCTGPCGCTPCPAPPNPTLKGQFSFEDNYNTLSDQGSVHVVLNQAGNTFEGERNGGAAETISLSKVNSGFDANPTIDIAGSSSWADTNAYVSPGKGMYYYEALTDSGSGYNDTHHAFWFGHKLFGTGVTTAADAVLRYQNVIYNNTLNETLMQRVSDNYGGISSFHFLPEILTPGTEFGFFDVAAVPGGSWGRGEITSNQGMLFDWDAGKFLFTHLDWDGSRTSASSGVAGIYAAYGKLKNMSAGDFNFSGTDFMGGNMVNVAKVYQSSTQETYSDTAIKTGTVHIDTGNIFVTAPRASNERPIDGMVVQTIYDELEGGTSLDSIQPITYSPTQHAYTGPDVRNTHTNSTHKGFTGGFVSVIDRTAAPVAIHRAFINYGQNSSTGVGTVKINYFEGTPQAGDENVGALIGATDPTTPYGSATGADDIFTEWGVSNNPATGRANTYITKRLFAARNGYINYRGSSVLNIASADDPQGVIIGAGKNDGGAAMCNSCKFTHWGAWSIGNPDPSNANKNIVAPAVPYVAGEMSQELSSIITANSWDSTTITYSGDVAATHHDLAGNTLSNTFGNFSTDINMGTREIENFDINSSPVSLSCAGASACGNTVISGTGDASFVNVTLNGSDGVNTLDGIANGALFGPNATEIGGNFYYNDNGGQGNAPNNVQGTGIYIGKCSGGAPC
ncbi:MAG: hypothetical protein CMM94_06155, partial [Rickettsiales bacterium]|nr:hypothetical protein [Rickettsiales bacterium]